MRAAVFPEVSVVVTANLPVESNVFPELHEPFLVRASAPDPMGSGSAALGAFLTLRLVDRTTGPGTDDAEAIAYQARATVDFLSSLPSTAEVAHLLEITRLADAVGRGASAPLICAPLLAFAYWLEQEFRLPEALDVVNTVLRMDQKLRPADAVAGLLQRARILRLLGDFDEARSSYAAAVEQARAVGDSHAVFLSRIGDAIVSRQVGNLPGSETALRAILSDAQAQGDQDTQARAHHDLGVALSLMSRPEQALVHFYSAFRLYEPQTYRLRALSDVAVAMKALGRHAAAIRAFNFVVENTTSSQVRTYSILELLELAARSGDRVEFQRWRRELLAMQHTLPPESLVDFELKLGIGHASFGNARLAEKHLRRAIRLAEQGRLNDYLFRAESALQTLGTTRSTGVEREPRVTAYDDSTEVTEIADMVLNLPLDR